MAWNYSGDPGTSQKDEVRFLVGDTDSDVPLLQDEEINYLIDTYLPRYNSTLMVAAQAAEQIAAKLTGLAPVSGDGVNVQTDKLADHYRVLAVRLRAAYKDQPGGELDLSNLMVGAQLDDSIRPLTFSMGMHDNPAAGEQDFGGEAVPYIDWNESRA